MRTLGRGLAAAVALAAGLVVAFAPAEALAGPAAKKRLLPPNGSVEPDASGKVKARETRRGRKVDVKVRDLVPDREYRILSGDGDRDLGTLTTDRRGRGKLRMREKSEAPGPLYGKDAPDERDGGDGNGGDDRGGNDGGGEDGGDDPGDRGGPGDGGNGNGNGGGGDGACDCDWFCIQVIDPDTGECVLICEDRDDGSPGGGAITDFLYGFGFYETDAGLLAYATMIHAETDEGPIDGFSLDFQGWSDDPCPEAVDVFSFTASGETGLPLGVDSVVDLAGRAFEVRDAEGAVVFSGNLPEMEDLGEIPFFLPGDDEVGDEPLPKPLDEEPAYFLWIADGEGVLREAGAFDHFRYEVYIALDFDGSGNSTGDGGIRFCPTSGDDGSGGDGGIPGIRFDAR